MMWIAAVSLALALFSGTPVAAMVAGSATILLMACVRTRHASVFRLAGIFIVFAAFHCLCAAQITALESMGARGMELAIPRILTSDFLLTVVAGMASTVAAMIANNCSARFVSMSDLPTRRTKDDETNGK
jgi:hypothetical protein